MPDTTTPLKFTYCAVSEAQEPTPPRNQYYSYNYGRRKTAGLIFQLSDNDEDNKQLRNAVCTDKTVQEVLGDTLVVINDDSGLIVTASPKVIPFPDKAQAGDVVDIVQGGKRIQLPILARFTACTEPMRDILGCAECDKAGFECLTGKPAVTPAFAAASPVTARDLEDAVKEAFKHSKTTVAGRVYVSPTTVASDDAGAIPQSLRDSSEIDWSAFEERTEALKQNAAAAAATRKFGRENCSKCPAKPACEGRQRRCAGRFPDAATITAKVLAEWQPRLDKSNFEEWQLYAIARHVGDTSPKRLHRRHVALGGVFWDQSNQKFEARLVAFKRYPDRRAKAIYTYEELREYIPSLPDKPDPARGTTAPATDELKALWLATMAQPRFGPRLVGFYGYRREPVALVGFGNGAVYTQDASTWGVSLRYFKEIDTWSDFFGYFGGLPAAQLVEEGGSRRGYTYEIDAS